MWKTPNFNDSEKLKIQEGSENFSDLSLFYNNSSGFIVASVIMTVATCMTCLV